MNDLLDNLSHLKDFKSININDNDSDMNLDDSGYYLILLYHQQILILH